MAGTQGARAPSNATGRKPAIERTTDPAVFVGLAHIATRQRNWVLALRRWEEVLERFAGHSYTALWLAARANVLLKLGRGLEAELVYRGLLATGTQPLHALIGLLRALEVTGRPQEALTELESSRFRDSDTPPIVERKLEILLALPRLSDARDYLERIVSRASDPTVLDTLFRFLPRLYEGWHLTRVWLALESAAGRCTTTTPATAKKSATALRLRILLALRNYEDYLRLMDGSSAHDLPPKHYRRLQALAQALRDASFPDHHRLKIFGIGLSKTGTTTLGSALHLLGFQTLDWSNPLTGELICDEDFYLFDAFTDTPTAARFEELYHRFPRSVFIYTTRRLESWLESMRRHWQCNYRVTDFEAIRGLLARADAFPFGRRFADLHLALYFNHRGFEEAYRAHDNRVRSFFRDKPRERFLELDVSVPNPWQPLCSFLDLPVPSWEFPWENRGSTQSVTGQ